MVHRGVVVEVKKTIVMEVMEVMEVMGAEEGSEEVVGMAMLIPLLVVADMDIDMSIVAGVTFCDKVRRGGGCC